ncbi:MAG TPA: hypothetical protein VK430_03705 [Xanthobacteraceae bacterium]|nr:hypothetical protein [Xanthobacteraceae bacterium]
MFPNLQFSIDNDKLSVKGLPENLQLRGIKPGSKTLAELKHLSIASANITAAKFYVDAIKTATKDTDPHMFDAALLAAIVKYGSVFKPDSRGRTIDAAKIFTSKILIVNKAISEQPMVIDDPDLSTWKSHQRIIKVRDQVIAHDDRIIGNTECFAAFDADFNCEKVIALTQRTTIYSAIKAERDALPMCIDAVFTWLATEKESYCQLVCDEINKLNLEKRKASPELIFEAYKGLADAAERKARRDPYWEYDWSSGEKRQIEGVKEVKPE